MNQYHKDDTIDEMLKFLDNAYDIFLRLYGKDYPVTGANLQQAYFNVLRAVREENPEGFIK